MFCQRKRGVIEPSDYARWRDSPLGALTERLEQEAIFGLAGEVRGQSVLDIGCGDGTYSISACTRGARVTSVDRSSAMLEAARRPSEDCRERIACCLAAAEALPFDDNCFDIVLAVTTLCFVNDPQRAIQEAGRVLRPGGSLVIGELGRYSLWAVLRKIRRLLGSPTWRGVHFWTFRDLRNLIEREGLQVQSYRSAVYYPPVEPLPRILAPFDSVFSHVGQFGAAFLAIKAGKA
jgi:ubiquinone/menaquinone biosynthesis C-methylase UbiE